MTRILLATLVSAAAALLCAPSHAASVHRYEVNVDPSLERVAVRACFVGNAPEALVAESDGARFYLESMRIGARLLEANGDRVVLGAMPANTCVDYAVKLQPAQTRAQTGGPETRRVGDHMLTAIGDWLWRPQEPGTNIELRFGLPPGVKVSAPWQSSAGSDGHPVFLAGDTPYNWPGVVVFGRFLARDIDVPGATLHVVVLDDPAQQAQLEKWIENAARHVSLLYGRFPVTSLQIVVTPTPRGRGPVPWAYVSRGGGPEVHLFINPSRAINTFCR